MRRETMHVSHISTTFMRQCLRKAGFDMSRAIVPAKMALAEDMDLKAVTTVEVCRANPDQVTFLQAA